MTRVLLVRHGRTTANASGVLAGRLPNIHLDATGREQAVTVGRALKDAGVTHLFTSPLTRTVETTDLIVGEIGSDVPVVHEPGVAECDYGDWTGRALSELGGDPLWPLVQDHPSAVTFPGGESMRDAQVRAVNAVRARLAEIQVLVATAASEVSESVDVEQATQAAAPVMVIVSHGDVIKSILADALGLHLDLFQRIVVDPGSVSIIDYTTKRPMVVAMNLTGSLIDQLRSTPISASDATVGGRTGNPHSHK